MWGMTPVSEGVIQARGQGGERQVAEHDVVLVTGNGGILSTHSTLVLSPLAVMTDVASKPIPEITEELRPFFAAAREGRLVVQRCIGCGRRRFPPRDICSDCLGREAEWVASCGRGHVVSFNVMHQVYHPGFAAEVPYAVALVELDDGGRMLTNLVDVPDRAPAQSAFRWRSPSSGAPRKSRCRSSARGPRP